MGEVWLAERADAPHAAQAAQAAQVPQVSQVALKIPHGAWRRAGLAERLRRERAILAGRERAILAGLEHPHIARLCDAGVAGDGQPYLALEYVEGERIDLHCERLALDLPARLRLFVQAATTVAFAHSRQVVHRDLKPANIRVDQRGQVRLLDFGIAKLLDRGTAVETDLTRQLGRAYTPAYASPEQIRGGPIGAASDVYSLGVVLHELLTGSRPPRRDAPARPSMTVADATLHDALRGDLDAIVLKALRESPLDRYRSVDVLAEDVERHLQGRAVLAQLRDGVDGGDGDGPEPQAGIGTHPRWHRALPRHNLLRRARTPVGRTDELGAVADLLQERRLVTVVGTGGVGKTTLAQAVAQDLREQFDGGVWWVDLAAASVPAQLAPAIAAAARIALGDGDPAVHLIAALAEERALLVLDNCEHLAAPTAELACALLDGTGGVHILATSREPLRASGEQVYRLAPLAAPPVGADLHQARTFGAFQLLEQRIRDVDPDVHVDERTASAAAAICRSLDGVPLAVEMAASRVPALGMAGVQALLEARFETLRHTGRSVPTRQQTLRETLDWSCGLLGEDERRALRRLSTFVGVFGIDSAAFVVAAAGSDSRAACDRIAALVEKSLVCVEASEPRRYRLLETVRLYASGQLEAAGETAEAVRHHGTAMRRVADRLFEASRQDTSDAELLACFEASYGDWEKAFESACSRRDATCASAVLAALRVIDGLRGVVTGMQRRLLAALELLDVAEPEAAAKILGTAASCGWAADWPMPPSVASRRAVQAWRALRSDPRSLLNALMLHATNAAAAGHADEARAALAEMRPLAAATPSRRLRLQAAVHEAHVTRFLGDPRACVQGLREVLPQLLETGASHFAGYVHMHLVSAALAGGDVDEAVTLAQVAVPALRALNQRQFLAITYVDQLRALIARCDLRQAALCAAEALALAWEFDLVAALADQVSLLALAGDPAEAVRLAGFADAGRPGTGEARQEFDRRARASVQEIANASLSPGEIDRHAREGASWPDGEARRRIAALLDGILAGLSVR